MPGVSLLLETGGLEARAVGHRGHCLITAALEENAFLFWSYFCRQLSPVQDLAHHPVLPSFIHAVDDTLVHCLTTSPASIDKMQMMCLFVTESSLWQPAFGLLTLHCDISMFVFLLFVLLRIHYWMISWGLFFFLIISSNTVSVSPLCFVFRDCLNTCETLLHLHILGPVLCISCSPG